MAITKKYKGIIIPAVTPLTTGYRPDEKAVTKLFNLFYKNGAAPFILGTTGESASLPVAVKKEYIRLAGKNKQAGTVLYAGIASNIMNESVELANYCADNGVDVIVATVPSYYVLTEAQIKNYFIKLADAISLPLVIYNIPATTHMSIPLSLIDELSHHPNIIATKDSERSEERLRHSIELWKDRADFSHFLGWAARSAEALINGSDGLVPSTGNLFPKIYSDMWKAVQENQHAKAYELQTQSDIFGNLYQSGRTLGESLWALKILMKEMEICEPVVMPPLQPQSDEEANKLIQSLKDIKATLA